MATKSTAVVLGFLAILTVLIIPSGVVVGPQQIAFAQGVEEGSEGGEEIPFDDVKVVDGEEVIEVGSEEEEATDEDVEEDASEEEVEEESETDKDIQAAIEIADEAVHEAFPPEEGQEVSEEDILFHQGLCAVGISTEALEELGGCEVLPPFGED